MKVIKRSLKKKSRAILAVVMIFALLLAGTFAWNDFNQHKTDLFSGSGDIISVTLNDLYYPPENWTMNNATVNKEVSVTNLDISTGPAFVRLSIKEYLEAIEMDPDIFIEDNGEKVLFATWATGPNKGKFMTSQEALSAGFTEYGQWPVDVIQEDGTTQTVYYATTNTEELKNGIYGKPMMEPGTYKRWGTQMKANISHKRQKTDECDYEPYLWDDEGILEMNDPSDFIRQYIELNIGTQDVDYMFLEDWYANENSLGPYWIIDAEDGWVYWGEPLYPGSTTIDFIREVTLLGEPGCTFEYYIHIDMEAVGGDNFDNEINEFNQTVSIDPNYAIWKDRLLQLYTFAQLGIYEVEVNGITYYYRAVGTPKNTYYFCDTDGDIIAPTNANDTPQYIYDADDDCIKNGHLPDGTTCLLYDVKLENGIYWAYDDDPVIDDWRPILADGTLGGAGTVVTPGPTPTGGTPTTAAPTTATPSPTATPLTLAQIIATTPVGDTFTADGILWKVLNRDGNGNVLIISNYALNYGSVDWWNATSEGRPKTASDTYADSTLRKTINSMYAGFTELKPFAKVPSFNNAATYAQRASDTTSCSTNFAGGNTTDIMFALGFGDALNSGVNLGFSTDTSSDPARVVYQDNATTSTANWWLRNPIGASNAYYINTSGTVSNDNATILFGARVALFVNPNSPAVTIANTPVGGTFTVDGVVWRKLTNVDASGNVLIITEYVHGFTGNTGTVYNSASASAGTKTNNYSAYNLSNLYSYVNTWYDTNCGTLKNYAVMPTHLNAENGNVAPWAGWVNTYNDPAYRNGPTATKANATINGVAFVLSLSEANQYGDNGAIKSLNQLAYDVTAPATTTRDWWLRSPGGIDAHVSHIWTAGTLNYSPVYTTNRGVRPALWLNLNP